MSATTTVSPPLINVFDVLNNDIVWHSMTHMDLAQLTAMRRTSRTADALVSEFFAHRLRVLLLRYIDHTDDFRGIMQHTNTLISGSSALEFILPAHIEWTAADLDVYVPHNEFDHVVTYLEVFEDYERTAPFGLQNHYNVGIAQVVRLQKGCRYIDMVQSWTDTALHPIPFFWTTAVMNWVSADSVCCAYPDLTLQHCALLNPLNLIAHTTPDTRTLPLLNKYITRGFDIRTRDISWSHIPSLPGIVISDSTCSCIAAMRFFSDTFCLRTSLHSYDIDSPDLIDRQHITVSWRRGGIPCGVGCHSSVAFLQPIVDDIAV